MPTLTFQVLEGVDRGRVFRRLTMPLTIGREEGNPLRLNDERVSRFHAKVQYDNGDIVLTDLESTNGTRVNGRVVQISRLLPGDRVSLGRSVLLFGSDEEIAARIASLADSPAASVQEDISQAEGTATLRAVGPNAPAEPSSDFDIQPRDDVTLVEGNLFAGKRPLPPLPHKLTPSQAARLAEILDFLHRGLAGATDPVQANAEGTEVRLPYTAWQKIQAVQMLLGRYLRAITEPDALEE